MSTNQEFDSASECRDENPPEPNSGNSVTREETATRKEGKSFWGVLKALGRMLLDVVYGC